MDLESFRGIERLLIVAAGALSIYLGYRLFLQMPLRPKDGEGGDEERGEGKVTLPGGISIFISRVGPGVFFGLFGAAVIGIAVTAPLVTETAVQQADAGGVLAATEKRSYLDGAVDPAAVQALELARLRVRGQMDFLNRLPDDLRDDLSEEERRNIVRNLQNTKLELIRSVWGNWGKWDDFANWVRQGGEGSAPAGLEAPAALYRHRQE